MIECNHEQPSIISIYSLFVFSVSCLFYIFKHFSINVMNSFLYKKIFVLFLVFNFNFQELRYQCYQFFFLSKKIFVLFLEFFFFCKSFDINFRNICSLSSLSSISLYVHYRQFRAL